MGSEEREKARRAILAAYDRHRPASLRAFIESYTAGEIDGLNDARLVFPSINPATLSRWLRRREKEGGVAYHYGNRRGRGRLDADAELRTRLRALRVVHPDAPAAEIRAHLVREFGARRVPGVRSVQRFLASQRPA